METTTFTYPAADGLEIHTFRWQDPAAGTPVGTVQIAHGMGEHAARYARLADALTGAGWVVYANDHRGHGRTAGRPEIGDGGLGDLGAGGWNGLVDDVGRLNRLIAEEHVGPRVLLGHSMGSFAAQQFVIAHSTEIDALVLSGTTAVDLAAATFDPDAPADLTALNAAFEPARTPYDWLSRDEAEVDLYVADELCGNTFTSGFFADLLGGLGVINDRRQVARVRRDLPILLVAGGADPVGDSGKGVRAVAAQYESVGVADVTCTIYPDARHEIFNETNRDEVTADVVAWLDAHQ